MYGWQGTRFGYYANRMMPWLHGERLRQVFPEGHGKISAMVWNFTPFDGAVPFDEEIRDILALEEAAGKIPCWAVDIAVQMDALPHCGQVNFPEPIFAICRGIGREKSDPSFLFCFETTSATKAAVNRRADVLDAWVRGQTENEMFSAFPDVAEFVRRTVAALGEPAELKRLLVTMVADNCRHSAEGVATNDAGLWTLQLGESRIPLNDADAAVRAT